LKMGKNVLNPGIIYTIKTSADPFGSKEY